MTGSEGNPVALVEGQLAAYNAHDLDAFCAFFDSEVEVALLGEDAPLLYGLPAFRERYARASRKAHMSMPRSNSGSCWAASWLISNG